MRLSPLLAVAAVAAGSLALAHPASAAPAGWDADNGTVSVASGVASTVTVQSGWSLTTAPATPAVPGRVYTGSYEAQAATVGRQVVPYLYFYDSAGNVLDKVKGATTADTTSVWTSSGTVVAIAPTKAVSVSVGSLTWGSLAGEAHRVRAVALGSKAVTATDVVGPLRTVGNQVYDARGPLVLKGVNRVGLENSPTGRNMSSDDVAAAKRWGATMVRVPLSSAYWLSSNCNYSAGYSALVDSFVSSITSRGMVALLDLHTNTLGTCGGGVTQKPMADTTAVDFWTQAATRYKDNPLVAFELYNEPHDISDAVWLNGGTATYNGTSYAVVGMQKLYDTVRATGATNLVFVNGTSWASTPTSRFVTGTNIVHGVHAYTCPVAVDATCAPNPLQAPPSLSQWVVPAQTTPVVVTEFGWPSVGSATYNANVIALLASRGWGWAAFSLDGSTSGAFSLVSTAGAGASYQPSVSGMPVLTALAG
jgi:hypothetical protein